MNVTQSLLDVAQSLMDVAQSLLDVAESLMDGAQFLLDVAQSLFHGAQSLLDVAQSLMDGAQSLLDVVQSLLHGAQSLLDVAQSLMDVAQSLLDVAESLMDGAQFLLDVAQSLFHGAQSLLDVAQSLMDGAQSLLDVVQSLLHGAQSLLDMAQSRDMTRDCRDVMSTNTADGIYQLESPGVSNMTVYCDMTTDGGGWLVFQRRVDGSTDFYRTWKEYMDGFGDLTGEFWLGNEKIHQITKQQSYELRIDLEDFAGNRTYAVYSPFSLDTKEQFYTLHIGNYSGNAGDSLTYHDANAFTTKDLDLDRSPVNCAKICEGAWWYNKCCISNLNGRYTTGDMYAGVVAWDRYLSKITEMKLRPTST
ncbi:ficolin-3-like [Gigantopelta aegis]|uniref:ficolin-3-like n=1 Tax=Gigantopelta aegis TaxID=1735272 RepID=UPI001B889A4D|nr:ficolin-3-like [Gigantopelta aegis]